MRALADSLLLENFEERRKTVLHLTLDAVREDTINKK